MVMMTTERKATPLTDQQCNIVSEAFRQMRKTLILAKQVCAEAECDESPVLEAIADLVASYCGQQIK
jgi:hypothetical protein